MDFYRTDELLTEEERLVRLTVGRFVDERFLPIVADHYERATFPLEIVPELARLGVFGMHLKGYGAAGMSNVMYGLACQELFGPIAPLLEQRSRPVDVVLADEFVVDERVMHGFMKDLDIGQERRDARVFATGQLLELLAQHR